jgi:hypothetical protein
LSPNAFRRYVLTSVDDRALVYDGEEITLTPFCRWSFVDRPGCPEVSCRTCALDIAVRYVAGGGGFVDVDGHTTVANSTCGPCLPDTQERMLPRLVAILQERAFLQTTEDEAHPFHRDQRTAMPSSAVHARAAGTTKERATESSRRSRKRRNLCPTGWGARSIPPDRRDVVSRWFRRAL